MTHMESDLDTTTAVPTEHDFSPEEHRRIIVILSALIVPLFALYLWRSANLAQKARLDGAET